MSSDKNPDGSGSRRGAYRCSVHPPLISDSPRTISACAASLHRRETDCFSGKHVETSYICADIFAKPAASVRSGRSYREKAVSLNRVT